MYFFPPPYKSTVCEAFTSYGSGNVIQVPLGVVGREIFLQLITNEKFIIIWGSLEPTHKQCEKTLLDIPHLDPLSPAFFSIRVPCLSSASPAVLSGWQFPIKIKKYVNLGYVLIIIYVLDIR